MNIDYSELERGFAEEMQKLAVQAGIPDRQTRAPINIPQDTQPDKWRGLKQVRDGFLADLKPKIDAVKWVGRKAKQTWGLAEDAYDAAGVVGDTYSGARSLVKAMPGIVDNIGKFAPLAMGAMILPSLMGKGQGQQGGAGQPVVVNNYMGQKPNILTPRQGVHSLSEPMPKMSEFQEKKANVITKALSDAAKRRMANKVLDVVTPEEEVQEKRSPEELEVVTKYPELAKMLEDEQNKAYLGRLLQH
jgi:hypothetical protein